MAITIIFESEEWSNIYLRDYLAGKGYEVNFINFEGKGFTTDWLENTDLVVNRIFPSSYFRDHKKTYFEGYGLMAELKAKGVPMINSYQAFLYDFDKTLVCDSLAGHGINVPEVYCSSKEFLIDSIKFPCIVKPNRGGRSTYTYVAKNHTELKDIMKALPGVEFIFQEYIKSVDNYTIRIEVIDKKVFSAVRRSMDESGISSYHRGAEYEYIDSLDDSISSLVIKVLDVLDIKMGGIDVIESEKGPYIIDVNATSNYSKKFIDFLGKNPLDKMGDLIIEEYKKIKAVE